MLVPGCCITRSANQVSKRYRGPTGHGMDASATGDWMCINSADSVAKRLLKGSKQNGEGPI